MSAQSQHMFSQQYTSFDCVLSDELWEWGSIRAVEKRFKT